MKRLVLITLLLLSAAATISAQDDSFVVKNIQMSITDPAGKPYQDANAYVGVRLAPDQHGLPSVIQAGNARFQAGADYQRFQLQPTEQGMSANFPVVVYRDPSRNIAYDLALFHRDGSTFVPIQLDHPRMAFSTDSQTQAEVSTHSRAPISTAEWMILMGIFLGLAVALYFLIMRSLFRHWLFSHRKSPHAAQSQTLMLFAVSLVAIIAAETWAVIAWF